MFSSYNVSSYKATFIKTKIWLDLQYYENSKENSSLEKTSPADIELRPNNMTTYKNKYMISNLCRLIIINLNNK